MADTFQFGTMSSWQIPESSSIQRGTLSKKQFPSMADTFQGGTLCNW